jgi:2-methylcitrate dehydratase PrpD
VTAATKLAEFCAELRWDRLPAEVRTRTPELVLDLLGVAAGGSRQPSTAPVLAAVPAAAESIEGATVIGAGRSVEASWAALVNGTAAHALEMDDVTRVSSLHPGAAVIPAALAVAEEQRVPGAATLEAIVAGYEVTMRVGNALGGGLAYERGFHPTGVAGVFGAAIAAGRLLGLDAGQLAHALGIAGTMASGSLEYLADGAWTKRLNPGWAAHGGVVAARLAAGGFTGPATIFEGRFGLLHSHTGAAVPDALLTGLGESFQVLAVAIKPYGCCRYNHGIIDAMFELRAKGLQPAEVQAIRLGVLSAGAPLVADPIARKRDPRNVVDAQFSAPFAAGLALVRGEAGAEQYTEENVIDPVIRGLLARTACIRDDALDAVYPERWPAWVEVETQAGRTMRAEVEFAKGEPENPVSRNDLIAKFVSLTEAVVRSTAISEDAEAAAEQILALASGPDVSSALAPLQGKTRQREKPKPLPLA